MKLAYLANIRLPTEKAHGLQITQMCEAFAQTRIGNERVQTTLYAARRLNTKGLRVIDPYKYYGVEPLFAIRRVPCLDLHALSAGRFELIAFSIQTLTYTLFLFLWMILNRADIYYSRDPLTLVALSLIKPRRKLVYEAHQVYQSGRSRRLQQMACRRVGLVVAITGPLAKVMRERGAPRVLTAHDGFRVGRFAEMPTQRAAREKLDLPIEQFIVGYAGRLHTMGMPKGVETLIEALAALNDPGIDFLMVGGPEDWAERYRQQWIKAGLPEQQIHVVGTVPAQDIPLYLAAFDICTMPLPWTEHFAYFTSAMKLFEYMVSDRAILATDLPCTAEVIHNEQSALLVSPGDVSELSAAIRRLKEDAALRNRLAKQALNDVQQYEWKRRAMLILNAVFDAN